MNTLELNALYKSYGAHCALDNVSLSVPSGSRTVIVGPSGSGKTTLLRMIAGFEFPIPGIFRSMARPRSTAPTKCRPINA